MCSTKYRSYAVWCNEGNGWCGNTAAHKNAQSSTQYDEASIPANCLEATPAPTSTTARPTTAPTSSPTPFAATGFTWENKGFGKCRYQDGGGVGSNYRHQAGRTSCQNECSNRYDCSGYSVSMYSNCLLWLTPVNETDNRPAELSAGGQNYDWGQCSCVTKKWPETHSAQNTTSPTVVPTPYPTPVFTMEPTPETTTVQTEQPTGTPTPAPTPTDRSGTPTPAPTGSGGDAHQYWRVVLNGNTTWRPSISEVKFFSDSGCSQKIDRDEFQGATRDHPTFLCSSWHNTGDKGCWNALDESTHENSWSGVSVNSWRPACNSPNNCVRSEVWLGVIFPEPTEVRCVTAKNLGQGSGGGNSWNVGVRLEANRNFPNEWKSAPNGEVTPWLTIAASSSGNTASAVAPTFAPSMVPTLSPTFGPTFAPTMAPSMSPTIAVEYDEYQGWPLGPAGEVSNLMSDPPVTGISKEACMAMIAPGGGFYYDSVALGGWCRTIAAENVEKVRESYGLSWDATRGPWTVTYLPKRATTVSPTSSPTFDPTSSPTRIHSCSVTVFQDGIEWGGGRTYTHTNCGPTWLNAASSWSTNTFKYNDVSSLRVTGSGCSATLASNSNGAGSVHTFDTGEYRFEAFIDVFPNDAASSLRLNCPMPATLAPTMSPTFGPTFAPTIAPTMSPTFISVCSDDIAEFDAELERRGWRVNTCAAYAHVCRDPLYDFLMRYCDKTCNNCQATTVSPTSTPTFDPTSSPTRSHCESLDGTWSWYGGSVTLTQDSDCSGFSSDGWRYTVSGSHATILNRGVTGTLSGNTIPWTNGITYTRHSDVQTTISCTNSDDCNRAPLDRCHEPVSGGIMPSGSVCPSGRCYCEILDISRSGINSTSVTYLQGSKGDITCPDGSWAIETESDCDAARSSLGFAYNGETLNTHNHRMPGCWRGSAGKVNWNGNLDSGSDYSRCRLLCQQTAEPTTMPTVDPTPAPFALPADLEYEVVKFCTGGFNWVNHKNDNPGKKTCQCYPQHDQCLQDGECELMSECGRLEPSNSVVFLHSNYVEATVLVPKSDEGKIVENVKSCPSGTQWVNHKYDNPGKTTCECYPVGDPCLKDEQCEEYPECSQLEPSEDVVFLGHYTSQEEAIKLIKTCPEGKSWANRMSGSGKDKRICECLDEEDWCFGVDLCEPFDACSTLEPSDDVTFTGYYEIIVTGYPTTEPYHADQAPLTKELVAVIFVATVFAMCTLWLGISKCKKKEVKHGEADAPVAAGGEQPPQFEAQNPPAFRGTAVQNGEASDAEVQGDDDVYVV